jgi:hypothetical protein
MPPALRLGRRIAGLCTRLGRSDTARMNLPCPWPRAAAAMTMLFLAQAAALAQDTPATRQASSASAPDAAGASCTRRLRAYERSEACYARFRTVHGLKSEAAERCGPPLKEPVDCPRP